MEGVGFLELADNSIHTTGLLEERFGIACAAAGGEIIAAVDVNGAGEAGNRVRDGMDDVVSERLGVFFAERAGAGGFELAGGAARNATPEDVVLAAGVNTDHGPHLVIVGKQRHVGSPNNIEDGEGVRAEESLNSRTSGLAESFQNCVRIRDSAGGDLANEVEAGVLLENGTAIADELIQFKHSVYLLPESGLWPVWSNEPEFSAKGRRGISKFPQACGRYFAGSEPRRRVQGWTWEIRRRPLGLQGSSARRGMVLFFKRSTVIPARAAGARDGEELRHRRLLWGNMPIALPAAFSA